MGEVTAKVSSDEDELATFQPSPLHLACDRGLHQIVDVLLVSFRLRTETLERSSSSDE